MRQTAGVKLYRVHHIAIIAADHQASKRFYCDVLGCELLTGVHRTERDSWMGDLALNGEYLIELFSFPAARLGPAIRRPPGCATWPSSWMPSIRSAPS